MNGVRALRLVVLRNVEDRVVIETLEEILPDDGVTNLDALLPCLDFFW